jgi:hypothetical protein
MATFETGPLLQFQHFPLLQGLCLAAKLTFFQFEPSMLALELPEFFAAAAELPFERVVHLLEVAEVGDEVLLIAVLGGGGDTEWATSWARSWVSRQW